MRILWVSNIAIGPAEKILDLSYSGTSGGWIQSEYDKLDKEKNQMFFLCSSKNIKKNYLYKRSELGEAYCIKAPFNVIGIKTPNKTMELINKIIEKIKPDIINIWGTETFISNAVANSSYPAPKVVFIQGLLGIHERYMGGYFYRSENKSYYKGIGTFARLRDKTITIRYKKQAEIEKDTFKKSKNIILDNDFEIAYCKSLDDDISCYMHNLEPNKIFTKYKWDSKTCEKNTIFTVFGGNLEKGIQQLIKALNIVKKKYPDVELRIPGNYPVDENQELICSKKKSFITILKNMIDVYDLKENIVFTGKLTPEEMAEHISKSNLFVNPSCMEVHALSLREAMLVGTPCISSLCGSVVEFMQHGVNGLIYRYEEYEVLAHYICKVFESPEYAQKISGNNPVLLANNNTKNMSLIEIYEHIVTKYKKDK